MNKKISHIFIVITAIIWGSSPAISKILLTNLDPFQIMFYYFSFATIFLLILSLKNNKSIFLNYKKIDYVFFIILGILGGIGYDYLLLQGYLKAPAQEIYVVNYTYPILIVIFGIVFLKQNINIYKIIAILLGFIGVSIVITKGNIVGFASSMNLMGLSYAFLAAIFYGLFSIIGKIKNYDVYSSMFFYHLISTFISIILIYNYSYFIMPNIKEFLLFIYMGCFVNALAYTFWFLALKYGDIQEISNIIFIAPFISLIFLYIFTGEKIHISSFLGLIFIIIGIFLQNK